MTVSSLFIKALPLLFSLTPCLCISDVCIRYNLRGACNYVPGITRPTVAPKPTGLGAEYCTQACSEYESYKYSDICDCPHAPTTPTPCVTSYLENFVCEYDTTVKCLIQRCLTRQKAIKALKRGISTCECPVKELQLPDVCERADDQSTLCMTLKGYNFLPADTECMCFGQTSEMPLLNSVCYYGIQRATNLNRRKRLYNGRKAKDTCDYPGIAGIFKDVGTDIQRSTCTGVLVDEQTILISKQCKLNIDVDNSYVHVSSYNIADVTKILPTKGAVFSSLSVSTHNRLYFMRLKSKITFDTACVLPACLPNKLYTSADIDFDNCRMVSYGNSVNLELVPNFKGQNDTLLEIDVQVVKSSITKQYLTVVRKDEEKNTACTEDDSAPVLCPLTSTNEWVVVGVSIIPGFPCKHSSDGATAVIANVLKESEGRLNYYSALINTKYSQEKNLLA